jgi:methyl-accepting chemotaxis protein
MTSFSRRKVLVGLAIISVSCIVSAFANWLAGPVAGPFLVTGAFSAAVVYLVLFRGAPAGSDQSVLATMISREIDHIMIGSAETSYFVDSIKKNIDQNVQTTKTIAESSGQNSRIMAQIASNAETATKVASTVCNQSVAGRVEVNQGLTRISDASLDAQTALNLMKNLQEKARSIHGITEQINRISAQTNLLALNAAIEAARAGEHGRGFAVVAGEVRLLAQNTKDCSDDIGKMVKAMSMEAERAANDMTELTNKISDAVKNVEQTQRVLKDIESNALESQSDILEIAAVSQEHLQSTLKIAGMINEIRNGMLLTEKELPFAAKAAVALTDKIETLFATLTEFHTGSAHDVIRAVAVSAAAQVGELLTKAVASGQITERDLFDRHYVEIPSTNPQKHRTRYDAFTDKVLPAVQEKILQNMPHLVYAGAVDDKGYFPTHNKKFSQPLTGDYQTDLINNRTKRIFSDRTGARCGSNTKAFLLQTYKRDTGEVMHDLSAPIYVCGKHWGGFRIGYHSNAAGTANSVIRRA